MPNDMPTVFGPKATEQIAQTVREVSRRMMNPRGERGRWQFDGGRLIRPAVIGTALSAPASSLVTATTCTIYFLLLLPDGTQEVLTQPETVYNDDPEVTAEIGTYCRVEPVNGRWMISYLGCDPQQALIDALP